MSVFSILEGATFAEDDVSLVMRQDLSSKIESLVKEMAKTRRSINKADDVRLGSPKLSDIANEELQELELQVEALEDLEKASVLTFHMRGVSTDEYSREQAVAGRPRKDHPVDSQVGYNINRFYQNLIKKCTFSIEAPDGSSEKFDAGHWETIWRTISDDQYDDLCACANRVNRKAKKAHSMVQSSVPTNGLEQQQKPLMDLESAINDSQDGNPEK
jgi:hypothetical protein